MRMLLTSPFILPLLLACIVPAHCKGGRGGGSSSSGDSSSGSDSSSSNSDSGGSDSSSYLDCTAAITEQQDDVYSASGSYYNGTVRVSHRVKDSPTKGCSNSDRSPKSYEYDAVVLVGPPQNQTDPNDVYWALRAFRPKGSPRTRSCSDYTPFNPCYDPTKALDEFIRIQSTEDVPISLTFSEKFEVLWNSELTPDKVVTEPEGEDGDNLVTSWNLTSTYDNKAPFSYSSVYSSDDNTTRTSGFVTLSDVCINGYDFNRLSSSSLSAYPPISPFDDPDKPNPDTTAGNVFLETGTSISMTGIGSNSLTLTLTNGSVERGVVRALGDPTGCDDYSPSDATRNLVELDSDPSSTINSGNSLLNITVDFELNFRGSLVTNASAYFVNSTKEGGPHWRYRTSSLAIGLSPTWAATLLPALIVLLAAL
ncbi:MAG: hypothetical protein M1825_005989 [Sarcosagium campestre]|nr:MAG: hypothetical protein M1825_005989 [Sarcosagium campestre]